MRYFAGIDIGASATKAVIINEKKEIVGLHVRKSGVDFREAAESAFVKAKELANLTKSEIKYIIVTGYGRRNISFADEMVTEIACHGKGSFYYHPKAHIVVDIGGQDSKIVKMDEKGKRISFKMNRKCAAGTGAFLEEIANRLNIPIDNLNNLARKSTQRVEIGSYCTVFTSTEILSRIREGTKVEDLIKGIYGSVIKRILEMDSLEGNVVMTGGVIAYNSILVEMFEKRLKKKIFVPPYPQMIGAFGAALFALETRRG
ncbi:MAG: acyl-CoA dehydratase activase [Candidatus Aminicenantia bacterium]